MTGPDAVDELGAADGLTLTLRPDDARALAWVLAEAAEVAEGDAAVFHLLRQTAAQALGGASGDPVAQALAVDAGAAEAATFLDLLRAVRAARPWEAPAAGLTIPGA